MKSRFLKKLLALIVLGAILAGLGAVHAEGATLKISSAKASYVIGETITLSITAANAPALLSVGFDVRFDPDKVTFVSGSINGTSQGGGMTVELLGGSTDTVRASAYNYLVESATIATLKFKAKAVSQQTAFTLGNIVLGTETGEVDATPLGSYKIAVTEPPVLSKNADLKSLQIAPGTLTPAFSSDNTVYAAEVPSTATSLTVSAVAADSKATCAVSGHKGLQPGDNTVRVVVTAESGATKTYTIRVTRPTVSPTPGPSVTPVPSPAPSVTPAVTLRVNGRNMTVAALEPGKSPPPGFSEAPISLQNQMVPAYVSDTGGLTLVYLKENGVGAFYVYDAATGSFAPFRSLTVPARQYVLLPADGIAAPAGFKAATVSVAGQSISGFQSEKPGTDGVPTILVHLMDASGIKALYVWNARTGEPARYVPASGPQPSAAPTPSPAPSASVPADPGQTGSGSTGGPESMVPYILAIAGLAALVVVLGAILLYKQFGNRRHARQPYPTRLQPPPIRRVD